MIPESLAHALEVQWQRDACSPAQRATLVARALYELAGSEQEAWGQRVGRCLLELSDYPFDPMQPDQVSACRPLGTRGQAFAFEMASHLEATLTHQGNLSTRLLACLELLRAPLASEAKQPHAFRLGRSIATTLLPTLSQACRYDDIAAILSSHFEPDRQDLCSILQSSGACFDHPGIASSILEALPRLASTSLATSALFNRLTSRVHPAQFYFCPRRAWREGLIASHSGQAPGADRLAAWVNLTFIQMDATRLSKDSANPEHVVAARAFIQEAIDARTQLLILMATSEPHQAARLILRHSNRATAGDLWNRVGLLEIDAADFFETPFDLPSLGGVSRNRLVAPLWPRAVPGARGLRLNYLDCVLLCGGSKDELTSLAQAGARLGPDIERVLALLDTSSGYTRVVDALWLTTFIANPTPPNAPRTLRL